VIAGSIHQTKHHREQNKVSDNYFVTGHLGFKGEWLVRILVAMGARVTGYSLVPQHVSVPPEPVEHSRVVNIIGDVLDQNRLTAALQSSGASIAFHLAAQPLVRVGQMHPYDTFLTNVMGTASFLDAVGRTPSVRAVVVITSDKVYRGRMEGRAHVESDELGPCDPYGASKACAELVCRAYASRFLNDGGPAIATARAGNVIGGCDWSYDRLVPDVARALSSGRRLRLRSPRATRPWQHVSDPVRGYIRLGGLLLRNPEMSGTSWNFGPTLGDTMEVESVVQAFVQAWGGSAQGFGIDVHSDWVRESEFLAIDSTVARSELEWEPAYSAHDAVRAASMWYRAYHERADHAGVMASQVARAVDSELGLLEA